MLAKTDTHTTIIRCGTPECDWGFRLPDMAAWRIERCYAEFKKHCAERHGLLETDMNAEMYLDLKVGTLTLWKDE
jgi:hypothetical protein